MGHSYVMPVPPSLLCAINTPPQKQNSYSFADTVGYGAAPRPTDHTAPRTSPAEDPPDDYTTSACTGFLGLHEPSCLLGSVRNVNLPEQLGPNH